MTSGQEEDYLQPSKFKVRSLVTSNGNGQSSPRSDGLQSSSLR